MRIALSTDIKVELMVWSEMIDEIPDCCCRSDIIFRIVSTESGSKAENGSSSRRILGFVIRANEILNLRLSPPDNERAWVCFILSKPNLTKSS